jgi:hypothetical protein
MSDNIRMLVDIVATMIIGYWLGTQISGFWWF